MAYMARNGIRVPDGPPAAPGGLIITLKSLNWSRVPDGMDPLQQWGSKYVLVPNGNRVPAGVKDTCKAQNLARTGTRNFSAGAVIGICPSRTPVPNPQALSKKHLLVCWFIVY